MDSGIFGMITNQLLPAPQHRESPLFTRSSSSSQSFLSFIHSFISIPIPIPKCQPCEQSVRPSILHPQTSNPPIAKPKRKNQLTQTSNKKRNRPRRLPLHLRYRPAPRAAEKLCPGQGQSLRPEQDGSSPARRQVPCSAAGAEDDGC